jgi:hypothetical protein
MAQNRYFPIVYKIWFLYGEWDRNPPLLYELMVCQPGTVSFNTTFHQRVSDVSTGEFRLTLRRTLAVCVLFVHPSNYQVSHPCYRCEKTAFFEALMTVVNTSLAQVVLTLRSVFFDNDFSVLTAAE